MRFTPIRLNRLLCERIGVNHCSWRATYYTTKDLEIFGNKAKISPFSTELHARTTTPMASNLCQSKHNIDNYKQQNSQGILCFTLRDIIFQNIRYLQKWSFFRGASRANERSKHLQAHLCYSLFINLQTTIFHFPLK